MFAPSGRTSLLLLLWLLLIPLALVSARWSGGARQSDQAAGGGQQEYLHVGDIEFAGPGVEHWHGASPSEGARYIQQGLAIDGGSGVFWMEEVSQADYLGNDVGIMSRMRYLETGER